MISVKSIIVIILSITFVTSITINVIFFTTKYHAAKKGDIVEMELDKIIETIENEKDLLIVKTEENINDVQESFDNRYDFSALDDETVVKEGDIVIKIGDDSFYSEYSTEIASANEKVVFLADQINVITASYLKDIEDRDNLIDNITEELKIAKETIKDQIMEYDLNLKQQEIKKNMFRFGLDLYYFNTLNTRNITLNHGGGVGLNLLITNKFNIRVNIGIQQDMITPIDIGYNPHIGLSIGYFF